MRYKFSYMTGEYLEEVSDENTDMFTTDLTPPSTSEKEVAVFSDGWTVQPDHRGETWWRLDGKPEIISRIGPVSSSLSQTQPIIVPEIISRAQCSKRMRQLGIITNEESLAMVRNGIPPQIVVTLIEYLPTDHQQDAYEDFARDSYSRSNPLLNQLMIADGKSSSDIDNFFIEAAQL